ncbi:hypothetical protein BHE74_00033593 [Ensete ventricosum]|nr:hypothetical protein BHE74_00033593 [Ensete ventricosum]
MCLDPQPGRIESICSPEILHDASPTPSRQPHLGNDQGQLGGRSHPPAALRVRADGVRFPRQAVVPPTPRAGDKRPPGSAGGGGSRSVRLAEEHTNGREVRAPRLLRRRGVRFKGKHRRSWASSPRAGPEMKANVRSCSKVSSTKFACMSKPQWRLSVVPFISLLFLFYCVDYDSVALN